MCVGNSSIDVENEYILKFTENLHLLSIQFVPGIVLGSSNAGIGLPQRRISVIVERQDKVWKDGRTLGYSPCSQERDR